MVLLHIRILCASWFFTACFAACPLTNQEVLIKDQVEKRSQLASDGRLVSQIRAKTYTVDSLIIEMYSWWVQLGLANHRMAIENFESMITDAGLPESAGPVAKDWVPIMKQWANAILDVCSNVPALGLPVSIIRLGISSYTAAAYIAADPEQGGSTDFLKAARKWRKALPDRETSQLSMISDFANALKTNFSEEKLLDAYKFVTRLIKSTQSYRYLFNLYYKTYMLGSTGTENSLRLMVSVQYSSWPFASDWLWNGVLWSAAPWKQDGCTIARNVLDTNDDCLDVSTPVLGSLWSNPIYVPKYVQGRNGWGVPWPGGVVEFSCEALMKDKYVGCWMPTVDAEYSMMHLRGQKNFCQNMRVYGLWNQGIDPQDVFNSMRQLCTSHVNSSTLIATGKYNRVGQGLPVEVVSNTGIASYSCSRQTQTAFNKGAVSANANESLPTDVVI